MDIEIVSANIIDICADAIVLPANEKLKEGSGTSKAIFEAAGRSNLKQECEKIGHCEVGSAVPTSAYNLNAKYIIHAVVPKWRGGNNNEYGLLSSGTICVPFGFTKEMRTLCGTTATVVSTIGSGDRVSVRLSPDPAWSISAAMLEPDVENDIQESDHDLKSLFV